MSQFFTIHEENPQVRLLRQAVEIIRQGGVVVFPTDSAYALGCHLGDKTARDRVRRIRQLNDRHFLTLICYDLSDLSVYAKVSNVQYRMLKNNTPGPYTFILPGTREVPRRLLNPRRREIGLRIPDNAIARQLVAELGAPMLSTTLILPGDEFPMTDPYDIRHTLEHSVDLVIDGGYCGIEPTTVIDMVDAIPVVVRQGLGDPGPFQVG